MRDHEPSAYTEALLALYRGAVAEQNAEALTQSASDTLGNPIIIVDRNCRLLLEIGLTGHDSHYVDTIHECGRIPDETVSALQKSHAFRLSLERNDAVFMEESPLDCPILLSRLCQGRDCIGFAILMQMRGPFVEADSVFFSEFCTILGTRIWTSAGQEEVLTIEETIRAVLAGRLFGDRLRYQLRSFGFTANQHRCLMIIQERQSLDFDFDETKSVLDTVYPKCRSMMYRNRLLVLVPISIGQAMAADVRAGFKSFLRKHNLVCGCSNAFLDLGAIPSAYEQASAALRFGIHRTDRGPILYLWEFAVSQMCDYLNGQCDLRSFCQPMIKILQNYDIQNNTMYLETLKTYVNTGCNIPRTAELLCVHRNTIDYRLDRLQTIFAIDYHDPNLVYSFFLSFQILSYLEQED